LTISSFDDNIITSSFDDKTKEKRKQKMIYDLLEFVGGLLGFAAMAFFMWAAMILF
jgi:hypothetical protein